MEFSLVVKQSREKQYKTAKAFFERFQLPCSYFYYSKIEAGTTPEVELAIKIAEALGINKRKALFAWVRSQMPDSETKSMFTELGDNMPLSADQMSVSRSLVINRMQAKLLEENPAYWELLLLMSSFTDLGTKPDRIMAGELRIALSELRVFQKKLFDHGLIDKDEKGNFKIKEWLFIPYSAEFYRLRDLNFLRAFDQFQKVSPDKRFRTTITRRLTPQQQREIESKVVALSNSIVDMKEYTPTQGAEVCTVGIFSSPRLFGDN